MRTESFKLGDGQVVEFEIDESERSASERDVDFEAWGANVDRLDGFAAAMRMLVPPGQRVGLDIHGQLEKGKLLPEEVIVRARRELRPDAKICVHLNTPVPWQQSTNGHIRSDGYRPGTTSFCAYNLYPKVVSLAALIGPRSVTMDATATALATQEDMEDVFLRLCSPKHIVFATALNLDHPDVAPVERCASYHADAAAVARDLALSWLFVHEQFLHDRLFMDRMATVPLAELAAHVERAPNGARIGVAATWRHLLAYAHKSRKGPRIRVPGDVELTREQVLAALATPPSMLLEALDACAVPDAEWRAAEPVAREVLKATRAGAPSEDVRVTSNEHTHWIEQHAPYHVRRLPNGGVMLATHPYRVLWHLWADALVLLGIREAG